MSCDGESSIAVIGKLTHPIPQSCSDSSPSTDTRSPRIKDGKLRRHKEKFFGSKWEQCLAVLYQDSTLVWYDGLDEKDPKVSAQLLTFLLLTSSRPQGSLLLSRLAPFIAVGAFTNHIPKRPELPRGASVHQLLAIGTGRGGKIHWFLAHSDQDLAFVAHHRSSRSATPISTFFQRMDGADRKDAAAAPATTSTATTTTTLLTRTHRASASRTPARRATTRLPSPRIPATTSRRSTQRPDRPSATGQHHRHRSRSDNDGLREPGPEFDGKRLKVIVVAVDTTAVVRDSERDW